MEESNHLFTPIHLAAVRYFLMCLFKFIKKILNGLNTINKGIKTLKTFNSV